MPELYKTDCGAYPHAGEVAVGPGVGGKSCLHEGHIYLESHSLSLTRTHSHARTRANTRTHARMHAHTHTHFAWLKCEACLIPYLKSSRKFTLT
jgi:hypothetical protein